MQFLTLTVMLAVTLAQYFTTIHFTPWPFKYLPEALSVIVAALIIMVGPRDRFRLVAPRYWLTFLATATVMGCGLLANNVAPGPLLEGLRFYLRALPMFFLPAVLAVSDSQLRMQLRVLLAVALLQLPLSIYQRYTIYARGHMSGDDVIGTLMNSAILSIFLIGVICIAAALTLRGRMSKIAFFCLFVLLVVPTTINETKGTVLLLPFGLLTTLLAGSRPQRRLRVGLAALLLLTVFGTLFVPTYNFFSTVNNPYPYTIQEFFGSKKSVIKYLDKEADVGSRGEVGRVDSVVAPLHELSSDPVHLMLGVGIGNASASSLGSNYTGAYYSLLGRYTGETSAATFLVESGVLGLTFALLLDWLIFLDAIYVARYDSSLVGALALGWLGIMVVMIMTTFYKEYHVYESLSYLFWYFSGVIAAQRTQLQLEARTVGMRVDRTLMIGRAAPVNRPLQESRRRP